MNYILYYSNNCKNSAAVLSHIGKSTFKDKMHFICVDNRIQQGDDTYIVLSDGQKVLLPPNINAVPALLLPNRGYRVVFGDDILKHLQEKIHQEKQSAVVDSGEPIAFSFGGSNDVVSDQFSFLDQSADDLSAKGNGGLRQQYHYAKLNENITIETPPDTWEPDKANESDYQKYEASRNLQ